MIKKTTEIDAILLNLNKAIDAHYQWLVSMFHSVVARDASKPEITDNHSYGLCQFGRWIDHLGPLDNDINFTALIAKNVTVLSFVRNQITA